MTAILKRIDDPRSNLERARRPELERFAKAQNISEIQPGMPAVLMRSILYKKGHTRIPIAAQPLGQVMPRPGAPVAPPPAAAEAQAVPEVDAEADMARQWQQQQQQAAAVPAPAPAPTDPSRMEMKPLRDLARELGIHVGRRDNLITLRAKIAEKQKANG